MGKGAYISINNLSNLKLYVDYDSFEAMYTEGQEGSNFSSITGDISPGQTLPATEEKKQYIEANAVGLNLFKPSEFTMNIRTSKGGEKVAAIDFYERWCAWSFQNLENTSIVDAEVMVSIKEDGNQYRIIVTVNKSSIEIKDTDSYCFTNALSFAQLSSAAYQPEKELLNNLKRWQFTEMKIFTYNLIPFGELKGVGNAFVAGNETDVVLSFRGTDDIQDAIIDMCGIPVNKDGLGKVHMGFITALDSFWKELTDYIDQIRTKNQNLWICGHSLGASLATLATGKFIKEEKAGIIKAVYTYGQTTVGDKEFVNLINSSSVKDKFFRFVNFRDIIPTLAPQFMGYEYICDFYYFDKHNNLSIIKPYEHNTAYLVTYLIEIFSSTVFDHLGLFASLVADFVEIGEDPKKALEAAGALIKDHIMNFIYTEETALFKILKKKQIKLTEFQEKMKDFFSKLKEFAGDLTVKILDYHGIDKYITHIGENENFKG